MKKTAMKRLVPGALALLVWIGDCLGLALGGEINHVNYDPSQAPPNMIFLVAEDLSPDLGCYGNNLVRTPNLDKFASQGARFERFFTHAPVCAPSRSGLITGQYPTKIGSHHMRSKLLKPPPTFTSLLKQAGYEVHWPGKTDFNFDVPAGAFTSTKPWQNKPAPKQPFFAYANFMVTHESQIRAPEEVVKRNLAGLGGKYLVKPEQVAIPPYYPDVPEVRRDIANYLNNISAMDLQVGKVLDWIDKEGIADNTVVVFFGDHGWGMPRGKRWLYDSGIRAPLLVRWPGKIPPGTVREDLVAEVDLSATVLSLARTTVPKEFDGQVFLPQPNKPREFVFAARDRMDAPYDRSRAARDSRFKYIRNYRPGTAWTQPLSYMDDMPTMQVLRKMDAAGQLVGAQTLWMAKTKPPEELYDTLLDPHEIKNLVLDSAQAGNLERLRKALDAWQSKGDLGEIPESELVRRGLVADVSGPEPSKPKVLEGK
jgi:uncharacterized sulfatase